MSRMPWLADVLRASGLDVVEYPGWKTRGKEGMRPRVVIGHHTATFPTTLDSVVTNLLVKGRVDLIGPLCHLGLNREGTFIVIAGGKANHAGLGSWMDANESVETIGIEAYNWGNGVPFPSREPWPQVQLDAYDRGVAALLKHLGRDQRYFCGHREWAIPAGRKPDPSGIDLNAMRARVRYLLELEDFMEKLTDAEIAWLKLMIAGANEIGSNPDSLKTLILDYRERKAAPVDG
jgi:hypothetical protein